LFKEGDIFTAHLGDSWLSRLWKLAQLVLKVDSFG
jgi:hypothetical protein